ncbi:hypothetical protein QFZ69_003359 [Arthrobacter sp. V1I7]|uniref:hypothetical protein n=1 Tax=Arthrobacter sp. V1I7 TaxID=3042274 RepID=UPI00278A8256|nr:hypothetical protein [Arthrobacter sp. V1I7]MDQ0822480.1 hypothetical protein [Arthrobacter sp. V1I7]
MPMAGDHVGNAVGDVLWVQDTEPAEVGFDVGEYFVGVVGVELGRDLARFEDTNADVGLGQFLTKGFTEPVRPNFVML